MVALAVLVGLATSSTSPSGSITFGSERVKKKQDS
jgi:hypothetical protein